MGSSDDPQVYGMHEFDATPVLSFMEKARAAGHRVTPTHLVGRAIAQALHEVPDFNVRMRGSVMQDSVDVFFIAAVEGEGALRRACRWRRREAGHRDRRRAARQGRPDEVRDDPEFAKTKKTIAGMPRRLLRPSMRFSAWVAGDRNKNIKALGVKASPFGSAMVTSIGMFRMQGFAPLARFYKMPLLVLVGEIAGQAVGGRRPPRGPAGPVADRHDRPPVR